MVMISRTELMTVMIPTYRSPPQRCRVALHMIWTDPFVTDMMKPDRPRPVIFRIRRGSGRICRQERVMTAFFPVRKRKTPHGGYELGDDGGQRGATHAHVKDKDKQRVQEQVQHSPDGHGEHARDAEPLGVDEIVHAKTYHDEQRAAQVDCEVGVRIGIGGVAGAEQIHQRPAERIAEDGQDQAAEQEHGEGIPP